MGKRNRFVKSEVERVPLSDGEWIEVKKELNAGEQKRLESAGTKKPVIIDGRFYTPIDWEVYEFERALIFITDWSLTKPNEKGVEEPVPFGMDALRALDTETFEEINKAVMQFTLEQAKEKNERKKAKQQETTPSPTVELVSETK